MADGGKRAVHAIDVIALSSNLCWETDSFEMRCKNGEVVRVMLAIDTYDQAVIGWTVGFTSKSIRDLMLICVQQRFGRYRTPHVVKWLSDNRSACMTHETVAFAQNLGLLLCFRPVRRAGPNGVVELFVNAINRDCVCVNEQPDAATVLRKLKNWVKDHNLKRSVIRLEWR